jgi:hypothetical protein
MVTREKKKKKKEDKTGTICFNVLKSRAFYIVAGCQKMEKVIFRIKFVHVSFAIGNSLIRRLSNQSNYLHFWHLKTIG